MNNHTASKPNWVRGNCIGRGSFGVVSLAIDRRHGVPFAVKSVPNNSPQLVRCLESEIRILKSLSSPYVVAYLGDDVTTSEVSSSVPYRNLHMEYMPGGTVADLAKRHGGGDAGYGLLRSYARCIAAALGYIHSRGVVHCDVKGRNVLVGGAPGTAKLADFGSAVELSGASAARGGTRGSPLWMAPEVVRGERQGPESDVWALGCTVIEMLTGRPAWRDGGADTLRRIGYSDELPELPLAAPAELRDFLDKCLRRDPCERWSCDRLLHHPFLSSCSPPSPPQIATRLSPRCVFDWSFSSSSSKESTVEIYQLDTNSSNAKQRIGALASNSGANWEESEGWEVVRHVTATSESGETTSEYADSDVGETSVSGRANWEYTDSSNASYDNSNVESTTNDAEGTRVIWRYRDTVDRYRCCMYILIQKLLRNLNFIQQIYLLYAFWFTSTPSLLLHIPFSLPFFFYR